MKTRYLVLGFGLVLALSLSVPALGDPLELRSGNSAPAASIAKKALRIASDVQRLAADPQSTARGAQSTASSARGVAAAAEAAATNADAVAADAQGVAEGAQNTAIAAQTRASEVQVAANGAASTAQQALDTANAGLSGVVQEEKIGSESAEGSGNNFLRLTCPPHTILVAGGFKIREHEADPLTSRIEAVSTSNWIVLAVSDKDPLDPFGRFYKYKMDGYARCLVQ